MNFHKISFFNFLIAAGFLACLTVSTQAQATRTWISGVGDDVNPCSRTAPCKTFAGAISKTAANGEINVLDPGGFGAVTITKSITLDATNVLGGIVVSGGNGITISDGGSSTIVVTLRGLDMNGLNLGLNGIRIISAQSVTLQNSVIYGFDIGISDERTAGGSLFVSDTTIRNSRTANVSVRAVSTPGVAASFENVKSLASVTGFSFAGGNSAVLNRCVSSNNTAQGVLANGSLTEVSVESSVFSNNGAGLSTRSGTPVIRVSNSNITKNATNITVSGGQILSYLNNMSSGNGVENMFSGSISQQ